ncbi:hypothetical protein Rsub_12987 [Raphidocelis subcapitata]|uniref:TRUD domain-containing protein n=1 Tax=Raphidocelis subcapitata TaxID=307507 RepID=A0A2V0PS98_9CHLO|nr:hypothetical protein Rsub_12987 [Raphidocelis subcapitata]|eukprot:GBG00206.1 hypothetical protein Rsub_12987 [Raphidocelis subcapitata]
MASEADVGITQFATPGLCGFTCLIKHRYSDFQVSEIGPDGAVARLTSTAFVPEARRAAEAADARRGDLTADGAAAAASEFEGIAGRENAERLRAFLEALLARQEASGDAAAGGGDGEPLSATLLPLASREARTAVHAFVRSDPRLPPLASDAVEDPAGSGERAIQITPRAPEAGGGRGGRGRGGPGQGQKRGRGEWQHDGWPGGSGRRYVKFVLYKENMETQASLKALRMCMCAGACACAPVALNMLSGLLAGAADVRGGSRGGRRGGRGAPAAGARGAGFGIAGTKDKRGITAQWVTLFKVHPARLAALNGRLRGIKLGDFDFAPEGLQLGQLLGNRFRLALRDVRGADEAQLEAACAAVKARGFVNYFGMQRFGTGGAPTHAVGALLLRREWEAAARLLMAPGVDDWQEAAEARRLFLEKGDAQAALDRLPRFLVAERAMLSVLAGGRGGGRGGRGGGRGGAFGGRGRGGQQRQEEGQPQTGDGEQVEQQQQQQQQAAAAPPDWAAALSAVPRTLRMMYLHAWQSRLWNAAASERVARFGVARAVEGDLVLLPAAGSGGGGGGGGGGSGGADEADGEARAVGASAAEAGAASGGGAGAEGGGVDELEALYADGDDGGAEGEGEGGAEGEGGDENAAKRPRREAAGSGTEGDGGGAAGGDGGAGAEAAAGGDAAPTRGAAARLARVHIVTAAEAEAGRFGIGDVVLPLPGYQVIYPTHSAGRELYRRLAAESGVDLESGAALPRPEPPQQQGQQQQQQTAAGVRLAAEFDLASVSGDYRRLVHIPADLDWRAVRYSHPDQEALLSTDWEALVARQRADADAAAAAAAADAAAAAAAAAAAEDPGAGGPDGGDALPPPPPLAGWPDGAAGGQQPPRPQQGVPQQAEGQQAGAGDFLGLLLEFSLPPSSYATMLLRELTRESTTKADQKAKSLRGRAGAGGAEGEGAEAADGEGAGPSN